MNEAHHVISIHDPDTLMRAANVESFPKRLQVFDLHQFSAMAIPEREHVLAPIIPEKDLIMLHAKRGVGKTFVALGIAYAVAAGGSFLKWQADKAREVLFIDGEMPARLLQERLNAIAAGVAEHPSPGALRIAPMDSQEIGVSLNLAEPADQIKIDDQLGSAQLLVIDNLSTLIHGGRENDAESWNAVQAWMLQLRRRGVTVLLVHHSGRNENARGTSKREDVLDTVIHLRTPDDYTPEDGARFEVHLTKARGVFGDDAAPFEARLRVDGETATWSITDLKDVEADRIAEMTRDGATVRDIAVDLGLSKSKINRIQNRMRDDGRL